MKNKAIPAIVAVSLLLAGCSGGGDPKASTPGQSGGSNLSGTVTMWYPPIGGDIERAYWDSMAAKFKEKHPNVEVKVEIIPWESRDERLKTAITGKATPDVTYALPRDVYAWTANSLLEPTDELIAPDKDKYLPNAVDTVTVKGKAYALPVLTGLTTTIYVKPVWDAMGVDQKDYPTTWEEVKKWAPKLKEKGYFITQYDAAPAQTLNGSFYPLLWSAGGTVLDGDAQKATVNSEAGVKALDFTKWLVDNDYAPKDALTQALPVETSPIAQKKVAMLFSRSTASLIQNGLKADELVVGQPLADKQPAGYGNVGGYVLFKQSKNQAAAKAWMQFIATPEVLKEFLPARKQLPARTDITDLYPSGSPDAALSKFVQYGINEPKSPKSTEIMNILKPHLQAALLGQKTSKEALDAAAKEIDAALAKK